MPSTKGKDEWGYTSTPLYVFSASTRATKALVLSVSKMRSISELDRLKIINYNSRRQLALSHFYNQFLWVSGREGLPFEVIFYM